MCESSILIEFVASDAGGEIDGRCCCSSEPSLNCVVSCRSHTSPPAYPVHPIHIQSPTSPCQYQSIPSRLPTELPLMSPRAQCITIKSLSPISPSPDYTRSLSLYCILLFSPWELLMEIFFFTKRKRKWFIQLSDRVMSGQCGHPTQSGSLRVNPGGHMNGF